MTHLQGRYYGQSGPLFWLYMRTAALTLITLGIYRFWAKTRIRKYIWSATAGGEDSFEYTGTGLEKFLGFLVAMVILAVFLGFLNLILTFTGLNVMGTFDGSASDLAQIAVIYANGLALIPLVLFATYRARRYKLARTRWRGLRFGMENGARGYVARALGYGLLTVVSLGTLMPLATHRLEKYMIDRTWYGDAKLAQGGKWMDLYPGMKHLAAAVVILVGGIGFAYINSAPLLGFFAGFVGYIWMFVGLIYYQVYAANTMLGTRVLDGQVTFQADAKIGKVVGIVLLGLLAIFGAFLVGMIVIGIFIYLATGSTSFALGSINPDVVNDGTFVAGSLLSFVLYVALMLFIGAVVLVMITQRNIALVVNAVTVRNADHLDYIQQRAADTGADAEGFADALDIGGAI